jgi:hypothetical protein
MNTKDLLKEAIADAKAVRETALAQAKLALEEAFAPQLQNMLAMKLQEMEDDELDEVKEMEEVKRELDELKHELAEENIEEAYDMESYDDDDNTIEEIDLDEILAELNAELSEENAELNEAEEAEEEEVAKEDEEDIKDDAEEDEEEQKEVKDLDMSELEAIIRDIIAQEVGDDGVTDDEANVDDMADMANVDAAAEEEEFNLDEILAELLGEEKDELDERKKYGGNKGDVPAAKRGDKKDTAEEEGVEDYKKRVKEMEEKLEEAYTALETVKSDLNEVNLLNAKLLYTNKIFRTKNLTESQKVKVLEAFDKAASVKEAKLVYETLSTSAVVSPKKPMNESLIRGGASKPAGISEKKPIMEADAQVLRMQKLAGIIK